MGAFDMFGPYSEKTHGDLLKYLREHDGHGCDSLFRGSRHFFVIKDSGLIVPNQTMLRVNMSPIPDLTYFVNSDFLLESLGTGEYNMSAMGAKKGVYDPCKALRNRDWSIHYLDIRKLHPELAS